MNRAVLVKEWRQDRLSILMTTVALTAVWLLGVELGDVLFDPDPGALATIQASIGILGGLSLALAQFSSESILKTRDLLVFRASGPAAAFRAKWVVGMVGTTLYALVPLGVWSAWHAFVTTGAEGGEWALMVPFAQLGTLGWAFWGAGALACQLRRGWGLRVVALLLGGGGVYGIGVVATKHLAEAPLWADWLVPMGSAALSGMLAWCAGRAFAAGVDDEVPLRDGPGLALALGVALVLGFPLSLVGPTLSAFAERGLRASYAKVVETEDLELVLVDPDDWQVRNSWQPDLDELSPALRGEVTLVLDAYWMGLGWPEPDPTVEPIVERESFRPGGRSRWLTGRMGLGSTELASTYEQRGRRVHVHRPGSEQPFHEVHDLGWSSETHVLRLGTRAVLADVGHRTLTLVQPLVDGRGETAQVVLEPLALPGGDDLTGVERLVRRSWAEVGFREPYHEEDRLLLRGERGLYRLARIHGRRLPEEVFEPYVADPDDRDVAASLAGELARYASGYAVYDGLDPVIEVRDAASGERLLVTRLAPEEARTEGFKALAMGATLLQAPVLSWPSFLNDEPWRRGWAFDDAALLGGRRPWLLALQLAFAGWLAWRVRRETRAWGRSPRLGGAWVVAVALLGAVGWGLYRFCEPAPVRQARAERAQEPARGALATAGLGPGAVSG